MTEVGAAISDDAFVEAFPFGFAVGPGGRIILLGRTLRKYLDGKVGAPVDEVFELVRPSGLERIESAIGSASLLTLLRCREGGMQLRGQLLRRAEVGGFVFFGTASIRSLQDMKSYGVQLSDFAPQDATPDLLMILQANEASLADARKLAGELEQAALRERVASESKGRFLAVMSHEIRTTLNGLGAMVDILGASPLGPEQREAVDVMANSTEQLAAILNDVLDLSRIESGAVSVERIPFEITSTCDGVLRLFRAAAVQRGLELKLNVEPGVPDWSLGDPARIRQVLSNLVGNALKFTKRGSVAVTVRRDSDAKVRIEVADTGPGISSEQQELLFQPFHQASADVARRHGGTGLGLTICRELVKLMGGAIELTRSSGEGSTFSFTIDAPATQPGRSSQDVRPAVDGLRSLRELRILIAEDNLTNRVVLERLLLQLDIVPTMVEDGRKAVEAVRQTEYDLVLMDLGMPEMDGVGAAHAIRALDVPWREVPIIACTAGVFREDREAARAAGMGGFLTKPIRLAHLREALARVAAGIA